MLTVGMVAGEASGDLLGAGLISALHGLCPTLQVTGLGGPRMIAAGCNSLADMERLSVMGLIEPLFRLPELFQLRRKLFQHFMKNQPDVFIGIDSPDFNMGLELKLRRAGMKVVHYVSPSVWAWRQKRIRKIAKASDLVLTLFPFEADFYQKHRIPVCFVGHPLADQIPLYSDKTVARNKLGLETSGTYIALLPGSRQNELHYLSDTFLAAAVRCLKQRPDVQFITSAVNETCHHLFQRYYQKYASYLPIRFFQGRSHDVMAAADIVLVTSGTATLETLLFKRPMVIAYRMANMTYQIARHLVKTPFIGLPNLLANKRLVPELIQNAANPLAISEALLDFLDHPEKVDQLEKQFLAIHQELRVAADQRAAKAILEWVAKK